MNAQWGYAPRFRVGIALCRDRLVAAIPGRDSLDQWVRLLAPAAEPDGVSPELTAALGELRTALAAAHGAAPGAAFHGELHVALLPPMGELRRVDLPGLTAAEAREVMRREPSRYFACSAESPPLELEIEGEGWRQRSPFTVVAAPGALIGGIEEAARDSGWIVVAIVPAEAAWAAAAPSLIPGPDGVERVMSVCLDERIEVLRLRGRRLIAVRRVPVSPPGLACAAELMEPSAAHPQHATTLVVGDSAVSDELRLTLTAKSGELTAGAPAPGGRVSPLRLAARFAVHTAGPRLLPETVRVLRAHQARRANVARFAASATLLFGAAALQLWGVSRERATIAAERARLREPVAQALAVRDSLGPTGDRLATIRQEHATGSRWSPLLVALSERLPDDAFLLSLHADGDSVQLEGYAARAEGVFDALRTLRGLSAVRPEGPIRQEIEADGSTSERFVLAARVGRDQ